MKTPLGRAFFSLCAVATLFLGGATAHASSALTNAQVDAILILLRSFGADSTTIINVEQALTGGTAARTSAECVVIIHRLSLGTTDQSTNGDVSRLQQFLGISPTGYFGVLTRQAVLNFQRLQGIEMVGVIGPLTRIAINRVSCASGTTPTQTQTPAPTLAPTLVPAPTSTTTPTATTTPTTSTPVSGQNVSLSLSFAGVIRTGVIHLPAGYTSSGTYPLMISFHGNGGTGAGQERITGFDTVADSNGFIVVYPDSNPNYKTGGQWQLIGTNNDLLFAESLIQYLESAYPIDATRVYVSGFSEGGGMAKALTCAYGDHLAGYADVSTDIGTSVQDQCTSPLPLASILFHGTSDPVSPYNGGTDAAGHQTLSAPQSAQFWASANGCNTSSASTQFPDTLSDGSSVTDTKQTWSGCSSGVSVALYTISGGGHTWPGGTNANAALGLASAGLNASQTIWQMLSAYRR